MPRAPVRLHQGHPGRLPHREDGAGAHDGGQPLRSLRLRHQALPDRPPAADHLRRPARLERVPRRHHRPADAGQRAGRGAADAVRPRAARRDLRERRRRAGAGAAAGVRGRRRRVPRRRPGPGAGARRADPRRGLRLHLQPRRRVPHRPLALAAHRVHLRGGPAGGQAAPGEGPARAARERAGEPPARQGRPLRRLVAAHPVAQDPLQARAARRHRARHPVDRGGARRDPLPPPRGVRDGHGGGAADLRLPADRQPQGLRGDRLRAAVARPARERAAPAGRALRHRAQRGPRHGAGPALPAHGVAGRRGAAARAACASSTPSR